MANIVDQLVVILELDSTKFKEGIEEAKATLKGLEGIIKLLQSASKNMGSEFKAAGQAANQAREQVTRLNEVVQQSSAQTKDLGEQAEEAGKRGEEGGLLMAGSLAKVLGVGGLVAATVMKITSEAKQLVGELNNLVGVKALVNWARESAESADAVYRFSDELGLNMQRVQAWQDVMGMYKVGPEAFRGSVLAMETQLGKLGTELRGAKNVVKALGIEGVTESMVKNKDALSILELFTAQMHKLNQEGRPDRALAANRLLRIDQGTLQALMLAGPHLKNLLDAREKIANSDQEIAAASKTATSWRDLEERWEHTKLTLVNELQPALTETARLLGEVTKWAKEHPEETKEIFYAISAAVTAAAVALGFLTIVAGVFVAAFLGPMILGGYLLFKAFDLISSAIDTVEKKIVSLTNASKPLLTLFKTMFGAAGFTAALPALAGGAIDKLLGPKEAEAAHVTRGSSAHQTSTVHVGAVHVNTQATDAAGIAQDMTRQLQTRFRSLGFVPMIDTGMD